MENGLAKTLTGVQQTPQQPSMLDRISQALINAISSNSQSAPPK